MIYSLEIVKSITHVTVLPIEAMAQSRQDIAILTFRSGIVAGHYL